jgi:competence ComEA-like helix-hairpin-helix protein
MFDLTKKERIIVAVLALGLVLAWGVKAYRRSRLPPELKIRYFRIEDVNTAAADAALAVSEKININTASLEDLMSLRGVGRTLAGRIIDHRTQKGPFKSVEELKEVKGIGEKLFSGIKDRLSAE